ncbi:hypothetical protein OSTOST_19756, partial [Ostertagia ostertagi]
MSPSSLVSRIQLSIDLAPSLTKNAFVHPFSGYNCKENVPEKIQVFLANAINSKRKEYNSAVKLLLGHVEFDCSLAGEAFTHEYQSKVHDGFHSIVERNLEEAITETLEKAIGKADKEEIWFGTYKATKVGCGIKLITEKENGKHWLVLRCKFSTVKRKSTQITWCALNISKRATANSVTFDGVQSSYIIRMKMYLLP